MDKASDFGSEDCRFESCPGRVYHSPFLNVFEFSNLLLHLNKTLSKSEVLIYIIELVEEKLKLLCSRNKNAELMKFKSILHSKYNLCRSVFDISTLLAMITISWF